MQEDYLIPKQIEKGTKIQIIFVFYFNSTFHLKKFNPTNKFFNRPFKALNHQGRLTLLDLLDALHIKFGQLF